VNGSEAPAATTTQGGLFEDLIEVLYAPANVFERTRLRGAMKYILVTVVISAVIMFGTKNLLTPWFDAQADLSLKIAAAQGKPVPDQAAASMRTFSSWGIIIGLPVTMLIGPFFNAAFLMIGAKLMKARATFGQLATIATLSGVPRLLGVIAMPVQALVLDGEKARSLADLSLGPARFIDPAALPPAVLTLLSNLDLFRIWQLVLVAIGVAVVAKVPKSTGAVVSVIMLGISAALQLIPSALF
jgi:hypothetical protein